MTGVIVVDTSEQFNASAGASVDDIATYKANTLPVLAHYDDLGKLVIVSDFRFLRKMAIWAN